MCCRPVRPGRKPIRTFDDAGQSRAFYQGHLSRRFIEITARGCLRAVESATEIDSVQIQFHDFLFIEMLLDSFSDKDFEKFSPIRFFFESKTVARQLLGNCACALPHMTGD